MLADLPVAEGARGVGRHDRVVALGTPFRDSNGRGLIETLVSFFMQTWGKVCPDPKHERVPSMFTITRNFIITCSLFGCCGITLAADIDHLLESYRHLHQHPELSLQEHDTAAYVAQQLKALGYDVTTGIGGNGLAALLRNGDGPTLLYRTDMDALPVEEQTGLPYSSKVTAVNAAGETVPVMHACGHDIHMTVLLGVAEQMQQTRDNWHGTLLLLAEPAEEFGAGAKRMLADGLFKRFPVPDYNLALHDTADLPAGQIGYVTGYALANVDTVDITVYGVGGHGAFPQKTRDPIVMGARIVIALQTIVSRELPPLESAVISVGSFHGGTKHNIIPDEVKLQLTVRSYADDTRELVLRRIREISQGIARSAGMPEDRLPLVTVKDEYTPSVYNDPALVSRLVPVLQSTLGKEKVRKTDPVMVGEDFARYGRTAEHIPSVLFWLGAANPAQFKAAQAAGAELPGLHSSHFAPDAAPTIETGVHAMSAVLVDLLN